MQLISQAAVFKAAGKSPVVDGSNIAVAFSRSMSALLVVTGSTRLDGESRSFSTRKLGTFSVRSRRTLPGIVCRRTTGRTERKGRPSPNSKGDFLTSTIQSGMIETSRAKTPRRSHAVRPCCVASTKGIFSLEPTAVNAYSMYIFLWRETRGNLDEDPSFLRTSPALVEYCGHLLNSLGSCSQTKEFATKDGLMGALNPQLA